jgi:hypothetical protein
LLQEKQTDTPIINMTDNANGNGETATTPSGGTSSKHTGKKASEQPALGAIESFKGFVYKYNTKDQQDMYNQTTKRLIDYVTVTYGSDMKNLVKNRKERIFTEPEPRVEAEPTIPRRKKGDKGDKGDKGEQKESDPAPAPTAAKLLRNEMLLIRFKEEVNDFIREKREYRDKKAKVFGVILSQCTTEMKHKLETESTFSTIEEENDVIGFLDLL